MRGCFDAIRALGRYAENLTVDRVEPVRYPRPAMWSRHPLGAPAMLMVSLALAGCPRFGSVPSGADPEKYSRAEYDLAQDEWRHGRLRSAMDHAQKASEADAGHAESHHFVGLLYLALCQTEGDCRFEEAERYIRRAISADDEYRPAKHTLGVVLIQRKRYAEAVAVLRPLAEDILYKTPELAWYDLGGAYLEQGDLEHAGDALSRAIALRPTFCWANYRLGLVQERRGALDRAEQELSRAVAPEDPTCRNLQDAYAARARVRRKLGRAQDSCRDLKVCVELSSDNTAGRACTLSLREGAC